MKRAKGVKGRHRKTYLGGMLETRWKGKPADRKKFPYGGLNTGRPKKR